MAKRREIGLGTMRLAGAGAVLYGISNWSVPAAFIVAGVAAIVFVEVRT